MPASSSFGFFRTDLVVSTKTSWSESASETDSNSKSPSTIQSTKHLELNRCRNLQTLKKCSSRSFPALR